MEELNKLAQAGKINQNASLRDRQAVIINGNIEIVWDTLYNINNWPKWHNKIQFVESNEIKEGSSFKWKINGSKINSTIQKIKKNELLTWTGEFLGLKAIHVWKLEETEGNQTIVTTEESMQGFLTLFLAHQTLHDTLTYWLKKLKEECESGRS